MIVFELILKHQTIVYVTETYFKMVSTLYQKWLTIFCKKAQNFAYFVPYDFVKIFSVFFPNTYQINNVWRDFQFAIKTLL